MNRETQPVRRSSAAPSCCAAVSGSVGLASHRGIAGDSTDPACGEVGTARGPVLPLQEPGSSASSRGTSGDDTERQHLGPSCDVIRGSGRGGTRCSRCSRGGRLERSTVDSCTSSSGWAGINCTLARPGGGPGHGTNSTFETWSGYRPSAPKSDPPERESRSVCRQWYGLDATPTEHLGTPVPVSQIPTPPR